MIDDETGFTIFTWVTLADAIDRMGHAATRCVSARPPTATDVD